MTTELATKDIWGVMEKVVVEGDLSRLSPKEKVEYYRQFCESLGLNPLTRPFDYIRLNGKEVLYAKKDATEQLRRKYGVSCIIPSRELTGGVYVVTARATDATGRTDESIGAVNVEGLKGDALANAYMKAETKAKRRVTLSICGLGLLDETEVETIPGATRVTAGDNQTVEVATGEVIEAEPAIDWAMWRDRYTNATTLEAVDRLDLELKALNLPPSPSKSALGAWRKQCVKAIQAVTEAERAGK